MACKDLIWSPNSAQYYRTDLPVGLQPPRLQEGREVGGHHSHHPGWLQELSTRDAIPETASGFPLSSKLEVNMGFRAYIPFYGAPMGTSRARCE